MSEVPFDLEWETLGETGSAAGLTTERAQVFGGWLVRSRVAGGGVMTMAFVPDEQFRWDGEDFGDEYEDEDEDAEEDEEYEEGEDEDEEEEEGDEEGGK